jgi:hypothetical protein
MFKVGTALVAAAAALSLVPSASALADLSTPDKALYCGISEGEPPIKLICWRAKDGYTVSMRRLSGQPVGCIDRIVATTILLSAASSNLVSRGR